MTGRQRRIVIAYLAARIYAILMLTLPDGRYIVADLNLAASWAAGFSEGTTPGGDTWQYPPGFALLLYAFGSLGLGIVAVLLLILLSDLSMQILLRSTRGALLWATAPFLMGPMMFTHLDITVALIAVVGVIATTKHWWGSWLLGVGASLKVWPGMLVLAFPGGTLIRRAAVAGAAYVLVWAVTLVALGQTGFLGNQRARGLQVEAAAAWPFMVAQAAGADVTITFSSGAYEVAGPLADFVATILLPISVMVLIGIAGLRRRLQGDLGLESAALWSLLIVLGLMLTSRVLSPQFNVWMLGALALALTTRRPSGWFRWAVIGACVTSIAAQALYPYAYLDYLSGGWPALSLQTTRLVALLVMAVATARALLEQPSGAARQEAGTRFGRGSTP